MLSLVSPTKRKPVACSHDGLDVPLTTIKRERTNVVSYYRV